MQKFIKNIQNTEGLRKKNDKEKGMTLTIKSVADEQPTTGYRELPIPKAFGKAELPTKPKIQKQTLSMGFRRRIHIGYRYYMSISQRDTKSGYFIRNLSN